MSKRLDGTSMFTGINAGLTNAFSQLNSQYSDGVTVDNLNKALSNTNFINNSGMNATFASYMTNNFNAIDSNTDGKISADFLPSSQVAEAYLKENLPILRQRFDDNNIDYDELNQRKQQRQNDKDNRKKGRKDE